MILHASGVPVTSTSKRQLQAWIAPAFLLSLIVASGLAQNGGPPPRLALRALDTDQDGKLSAQELQAAPHSLLKLDRNQDGQLTPDELLPRPENSGASSDELVTQLMAFDKNGDGVLTPEEVPARMKNLFERADSNHDGKLTPDEIRSLAERQSMPQGSGAKRDDAFMRMDPLLASLDSNHDGVISATEITSAYKSLIVLDVNGDGEITANEMRMIEPSPQERVDHMFDEWDTNKDGKISKAEAPDRMQRQFESIDKNSDGFLDRDELLQYFSTGGGGRRGAGEHPDNKSDNSGSSKEHAQ
jgi:Ca2+-binding EF-hand superfamily protein